MYSVSKISILPRPPFLPIDANIRQDASYFSAMTTPLREFLHSSELDPDWVMRFRKEALTFVIGPISKREGDTKVYQFMGEVEALLKQERHIEALEMVRNVVARFGLKIYPHHKMWFPTAPVRSRSAASASDSRRPPAHPSRRRV